MEQPGDNKVLFSPQRMNNINNIDYIKDLLLKPEKTLDIGIYCFTYEPFIDIIKGLHDKGIKVRAITSIRKEDRNDQFWYLQRIGIEVRTNSNFIMHEKFVIIDKKIVIYGSANWTITGFVNNYETIRVEDNLTSVGRFIDEFETKWNRYSFNNRQLDEGYPRGRSNSI